MLYSPVVSCLQRMCLLRQLIVSLQNAAFLIVTSVFTQDLPGPLLPLNSGQC